MAKTIQDAMLQLVAIANGLSGMRTAKNYPPDTAPTPPFAVAAPASGVWSRYADLYQGIHSVRVCILVPDIDTARDMETLVSFGDSFGKAVWADPTLDGTVETIIEVSYTFGPVDYFAIPHRGWTFTIKFKQEPTS